MLQVSCCIFHLCSPAYVRVLVQNPSFQCLSQRWQLNFYTRTVTITTSKLAIYCSISQALGVAPVPLYGSGTIVLALERFFESVLHHSRWSLLRLQHGPWSRVFDQLVSMSDKVSKTDSRGILKTIYSRLPDTHWCRLPVCRVLTVCRRPSSSKTSRQSWTPFWLILT